LHRSFMNTLKRKGPRTEPCGTPELARKDCERMPDTRTRDNNNTNNDLDEIEQF
jgi:hypothetical protein